MEDVWVKQHIPVRNKTHLQISSDNRVALKNIKLLMHLVKQIVITVISETRHVFSMIFFLCCPHSSEIIVSEGWRLVISGISNFPLWPPHHFFS